MSYKNILFGWFFLLSIGSVVTIAPMDRMPLSLVTIRKTQENINALFLAFCEEGDLNNVKHYLDLGADKDTRSPKFGLSGRHLAAKNGHLHVLKFLSQDDNTQDRSLNGATPLHFAAKQGRLNVVKWYAESGADLNCVISAGATPLHLACESGAEAVVEFLLTRVSSGDLLVNPKDFKGGIPIHYAAKSAHLGIVKLLLAHGGDLDAVCDSGANLLHLAVDPEKLSVSAQPVEVSLFRKRAIATVEFFINTGKFNPNTPMINVQNPDKSTKMTAFHAAAESGIVEIGRMLFKFPYVYAENVIREDVFATACRAQKLEFAQMLLDRQKIDVNKFIGDTRITSLHVAANLGHVKVIDFLIKNGADYTLKSAQGKTAEQVAIQYGYPNVANHLKEIADAKKAEKELLGQLEAKQNKAEKNKKKRAKQKLKKTLTNQSSSAESPSVFFEKMPDVDKEAPISPRNHSSGDDTAPRKLVKRATSLKESLEDAIDKITPPSSPKKGGSPKKTSPVKNALSNLVLESSDKSDSLISLESSQSENSSQSKFVVIRNDRPGYKKSSVFVYENEDAGTYMHDPVDPIRLIRLPKRLDNVGTLLASNHYNKNTTCSPQVKKKRKSPNDIFHNYPESVGKNYGDRFHTVVTDLRLHPGQKKYWEKELGAKTVENSWFELKSTMPARISSEIDYPAEKAQRLGPNGYFERFALVGGLSEFDATIDVHDCFRLKNK